MTFIAHQSILSAYFQADFFGKCIFLGLFALSILCWIVLIYKTLQARKVKKLALTFTNALEKTNNHFLDVSLEELTSSSQKISAHPFAQVYLSLKKKILEVLNKNQFFSEEKESVFLTREDLDLIESHVLTTISVQSKQLEKHLFVLSTIVTLAPFLGLLGTVWGILLTFSELQGGASAASNGYIIGGISTALVTTVLGLVIAIPALIFYNYLRNACKYFISDMEDFLYRLLSTIELQYRKPFKE